VICGDGSERSDLPNVFMADENWDTGRVGLTQADIRFFPKLL